MAQTKEQKAITRKWLKELRSGQYRQGTGYLVQKSKDNKGDKFCCLGVLCDMAVRAKVINPPETLIENGVEVYFYGIENTYDLLPRKVMDWIGLKTEDGTYFEDIDSLASKNDQGSKFSTIAKLIEKHPDTLFR
jgi:hypothetical protein